MKIWLDGELVDEAEARISVFDHGVLYGDGVFEGIRFYHRRVFRLEEHVRRLFASAQAILLRMPWTPEEVIGFILATVRANEIDDGYVRLVVTRGDGDLGLDPYKCLEPRMFIIASTVSLYPEECYREGLKVATCGTRRAAPAALMPQVKSLNYLNNIMAKIESIQAGAAEGLMLNEQGYVAECTGDNLFIVRGGEILTPPVADGALDGITRQVIFDLCDRLGLTVRERSITRYDIYTADECFLTGSAAEVIAVRSLDDRQIGAGQAGPVTLQLLAAFQAETQNTGTPID
jgi:branched-chain amino acid aminotransferase